METHSEILDYRLILQEPGEIPFEQVCGATIVDRGGVRKGYREEVFQAPMFGTPGPLWRHSYVHENLKIGAVVEGRGYVCCYNMVYLCACML